MTIYDLPQIKRGMWTTEFYEGSHFVITILQCNDRIQTKDQAKACAIQGLKQFNPKLKWDRCETTFTDELSL